MIPSISLKIVLITLYDVQNSKIPSACALKDSLSLHESDQPNVLFQDNEKWMNANNCDSKQSLFDNSYEACKFYVFS